MRLKPAILEFLANELHLESEAIPEEASFAELGVNPTEQEELLHKLQDALGIILPEDKAEAILTIGDLLEAVEEPDDLE